MEAACIPPSRVETKKKWRKIKKRRRRRKEEEKLEEEEKKREVKNGTRGNYLLVK